MNNPVAFVTGCIFIGLGLGTGLSCIGDGIKAIAKVWQSYKEEKKSKEKEINPC